MSNISEVEVWADEAHAVVFNYLHKLPKFLIKKYYETFKEGRLLNRYKDKIS